MMAKKTRPDHAELRDELDPKFQRAEWVAQRLLWVAMVVIIVAAALGFAGSGPFARDTHSATLAGGTIEVEYPRFLRYHAPQSLEVTVDAPAASGDTLRVAITPPFADSARIDDLDPEPGSTSLSSDGAVYEWTVDDWSRPVRVALQYEADDIGAVRSTIRVTAGDGVEASFDLRQFVLP